MLLTFSTSSPHSSHLIGPELMFSIVYSIQALFSLLSGLPSLCQGTLQRPNVNDKSTGSNGICHLPAGAQEFRLMSARLDAYIVTKSCRPAPMEPRDVLFSSRWPRNKKTTTTTPSSHQRSSPPAPRFKLASAVICTASFRAAPSSIFCHLL